MVGALVEPSRGSQSESVATIAAESGAALGRGTARGATLVGAGHVEAAFSAKAPSTAGRAAIRAGVAAGLGTACGGNSLARFRPALLAELIRIETILAKALAAALAVRIQPHRLCHGLLACFLLGLARTEVRRSAGEQTARLCRSEQESKSRQKARDLTHSIGLERALPFAPAAGAIELELEARIDVSAVCAEVVKVLEFHGVRWVAGAGRRTMERSDFERVPIDGSVSGRSSEVRFQFEILRVQLSKILPRQSLLAWIETLEVLHQLSDFLVLVVVSIGTAMERTR